MDLVTLEHEIVSVASVELYGTIISAVGPTLKAALTGATLGDFVRVQSNSRDNRSEAGFAWDDSDSFLARVMGFSDSSAQLAPLASSPRISPGAQVRVLGSKSTFSVCPEILGTVVDCLGAVQKRVHEPTVSVLNNGRRNVPYISQPSSVLERRPVDQVFVTGVRSIDAFLTLGLGQKICVIAEPGVGKSMLLSMLGRSESTDVTVVGLIGERGREVGEVVSDTLRIGSASKTVIVASTGDESPARRVLAAHTATAIAEYFRSIGLNVLLEIDSLTRLLRAYRELGLALGELPVRRGYPPSAFSELPKLIERAGTSEAGTITAIYTVLASNDLDQDPMVEEVRGLTDGHIVLSAELAERDHYPAVDILASISRLQSRLLKREVLDQTRFLRRLLSRLRSDKDLVLLSGAKPDTELELALQLEEKLKSFLKQSPAELSLLNSTFALVNDLGEAVS